MDTTDKLIALTTDGTRLLVGGTSKVYYVNTDWTYGVAFRLPDYSSPYNFVRLCAGWGLIGRMNNYGVLLVNPIQEYYNTYNPMIAYMTPYTELIDVDQYGGKIAVGGSSGLWTGQPTRDGAPGLVQLIDMDHKSPLYPLIFTPWNNASTSSGAETDPIPMLGYSSALIYFLSDTN